MKLSIIVIFALGIIFGGLLIYNQLPVDYGRGKITTKHGIINYEYKLYDNMFSPIISSSRINVHGDVNGENFKREIIIKEFKASDAKKVTIYNGSDAGLEIEFNGAKVEEIKYKN
jgi:hypothetical protein